MKKNDLINVSSIVKAILEEDVITRNSDSYLYLKVLERISTETKSSEPLQKMTVENFLLRLPHLPCPAFESVRRTRQKVQEKFPELEGTARIKAKRKELEEEFREFAREGGVDLSQNAECLQKQ